MSLGTVSAETDPEVPLEGTHIAAWLSAVRAEQYGTTAERYGRSTHSISLSRRVTDGRGRRSDRCAGFRTFPTCSIMNILGVRGGLSLTRSASPLGR